MAIDKRGKVTPSSELSDKAVPQADWELLKRDLEKRTDVRSLFIRLIQCTGARIDEVVKVDPDDVNAALKTGKLYIAPSKGSNERWVESVPPALLLMLKALEGEVPKGQPYAYLTTREKNRDSWIRVIRRHLVRICDELKIKQYNPHAFRHSYVLILLKDTGYNVPLVRKLMGHKNLNSTAVYCEAIDISQGQNQMKRRFAA